MAKSTVKSDVSRSQASHKGGTKKNGNGHAGENASQVLKENIVARFATLNTIESDLATLVRRSVADTLRTGGAAADEVANVIHHVVMNAIEASEEVGIGLTTSVKSVAKGIIMGVHDVGGDAVTASFDTVRMLVKQSASVGGDVGAVARHAVDGVIEATVDAGGNIAQVGKRAVQGAIQEAGNVSNLALRTVTGVLVGIAGSLGESLGAALPHAGARQDVAQHHTPKSSERH